MMNAASRMEIMREIDYITVPVPSWSCDSETFEINRI